MEQFDNILSTSSAQEIPEQNIEYLNSHLENYGRIRRVETNPLLIGQIISHILDNLDTKTLKKVRLVCQLWNCECRRLFFQNNLLTISIPPTFHKLNQNSKDAQSLKMALKNVVSNSSSSLNTLSLLISNFRDTQVFQEIPSLFDKVVKLRYVHVDQILKKNDPGQSQSHVQVDHDLTQQSQPPSPSESESQMGMEHLATILTSSGNVKLKELSTTFLNLSAEQSWLKPINFNEDSNDDSAHVNLKLEKLLENLNSLEKLELDFWMTLDTLNILIELKERLKAVSSLKINCEQVFNVYADEIGGDWKIQKVDLKINNEIPMEVVRHFLRSISITLKHLRLELILRRRPGQEINLTWECSDRFCISSPIPWTLTNLKILEIYQKDSQLEATVWKTFAVALELPLIETLIIYSSITTQFDEMVRTWNRTKNHSLESKSLKCLQIWPQVMTSPNILIGPFWPNLNELKIKIEINQVLVTEAIFSAIFKQLNNLKRLEMILMDDHSISSKLCEFNFDQLFVGCGKSSGSKCGNFIKMTQLDLIKVKSIRNLIALKYLKLECKFSCELHRWSDFLIYNGLFHLKTLQGLEVSRKFFSEKAIQDLKDELGDNVHIDFFQ